MSSGREISNSDPVASPAPPHQLDWASFVQLACPPGLERMLAEYAEVVAYIPGTPCLSLEFPEPLQALLESDWRDRLVITLRRHFSPDLELDVRYGPAEGSIAAARRRAVLAECARRLHALADSGVVGEMERVFGAKPNLDSISAERQSVEKSPG